MIVIDMLAQGKPVVLDVVREAEQQIAGKHFMESAPTLFPQPVHSRCICYLAQQRCSCYCCA